MIRMIIALALIVPLSGCAEKTIDELTYSERKELALGFIQNCRDQGLSDDSPEMVDCFNIEADRETIRREKSVERAQLTALALNEGAKSFENSARQSYRQPVNCTSNRVGTYVYTNCY